MGVGLPDGSWASNTDPDADIKFDPCEGLIFNGMPNIALRDILYLLKKAIAKNVSYDLKRIL